MSYRTRTAFGLLSTALACIFLSISCQNQAPTTPSPSATAPPQPSATPTTPIIEPTLPPETEPSAAPLNAPVQIFSGCFDGAIICPAGEPCALPSCVPDDPRTRPETPLAINESAYENLNTRFGLSGIEPPAADLGGLSPMFPLAFGRQVACENTGVTPLGGRLRSCSQYILETAPQQYELIANPAAFIAAFAPVTSKAEALSFAVALTGKQARYSFELSPDFRFYARALNPTVVTDLGEQGYQVNLYDYQRFGCGPHPHFEVTYTVSRSGQVSETSRQRVYEDPAQDSLCVD